MSTDPNNAELLETLTEAFADRVGDMGVAQPMKSVYDYAYWEGIAVISYTLGDPDGSATAVANAKANSDGLKRVFDALRWRKASEELPEPGVDVIVAMGASYTCVAEVNDPDEGVERYWVTDGGADYVSDTDLWLPIPPHL